MCNMYVELLVLFLEERQGSDGSDKRQKGKHKAAVPATQPITRETLPGYQRASPWQ